MDWEKITSAQKGNLSENTMEGGRAVLLSFRSPAKKRKSPVPERKRKKYSLLARGPPRHEK